MCGGDADTILFLPVNARKREGEREGPICGDYYFKDIISYGLVMSNGYYLIWFGRVDPICNHLLFQNVFQPQKGSTNKGQKMAKKKVEKS